ncbi:MAG: hypothetical protein JRE29_14220 [Deltaproteobacteria bacterium]|nr:hypothetical protein [Deltaproteobacteria bacterium]
MKIAIIVISCFVFLVVPQHGWTGGCSPLQISFTGSYQLVPVEKDVCGLRLNLPMGDNRNIYGLDLGFLGSASESKGIMLNLIGNFRSFSDSQDGSGTKGIQIGGLCNIQFGSGMQGFQLAGLFNSNFENTDGIQIAGLYNGGGEVRGIQVAGLFNVATSVRGIQIGLINVTQELSGLQIGLINYIRESPVPILPIINLKF